MAYEEVFRRQQPHVAWDHVAGGQLDDVPGHQVPEWYLPRRAVPNDGGGHVDHGLELLCGGVRPGFLPEAEPHAQHHHTCHHGAGARVACKEGNRRQSRQQDHQRVADDFQKADGPALLPLLRDLIRTRRARPLFGLSLRQASQRRSQVPEQCFAVLPGGVEDGGRNTNILVLRLRWNRRLVRASRWRRDLGACRSRVADQSPCLAIRIGCCHRCLTALREKPPAAHVYSAARCRPRVNFGSLAAVAVLPSLAQWRYGDGYHRSSDDRHPAAAYATSSPKKLVRGREPFRHLFVYWYLRVDCAPCRPAFCLPLCYMVWLPTRSRIFARAGTAAH